MKKFILAALLLVLASSASAQLSFPPDLVRKSTANVLAGSNTWKLNNANTFFKILTSSGTSVLNVTNTSALMGGVWLPQGNIARVTSDFTSASSTSLQTVTGLSIVLPANTAANYPFRCEIDYAQTVAAVADAFGIQAASLAPTNIRASGFVQTAATTFTASSLSTLSTTTATNIATFTPSAITTIWHARLEGLIENPSGAANTINFMVSQSTAADLMIVKRGSYCVIGF